MNRMRRYEIEMAINELKQIDEQVAAVGRKQQEYSEDLYKSLNSISDDVDLIMQDEEDSFNNLPENFQYSERGDIMQDAIDNLMEAGSSIMDAMDDLEAKDFAKTSVDIGIAIGYLRDAQQ